MPFLLQRQPPHLLMRKHTSKSTASPSTLHPPLPAYFPSRPSMTFPFQTASSARFLPSTNRPPFKPVLGPPPSPERTSLVSPRRAAARHWHSAFPRSRGSSPPAAQRKAHAHSSLRRRASSRFKRTTHFRR